MTTIADFLTAEHVTWLVAQEKPAALREMLNLFGDSKAVRDRVSLENAIFSREVLMSTGIGYGVAVPHAKISTVESFLLAIGIAPAGVPWNSVVDDQPVKLVCMIAGPETDQPGYLRLLATVMKFMKSEKGILLNARHPDEVLRCAGNYKVNVG